MIGWIQWRPTEARSISTLVLVLVAGAALSAPVATAAASTYHGHFKGVPGSRFDLRFAEADGKLFLNAIEQANARLNCENGPTVSESSTQFPSSALSRVRNRAFDVKQDSGTGDFVRVAGRLERAGKAAGIFKQRVDLGPPQGVCATGKLEWVAKKA
jgi:hypothetical protein